MDLEAWAARAVVSAVVAGLAGIFLRLRKVESRLEVAESTLDRFEKAEQVLGEIRVTHARILERLEHLPKHSDLDRLHDRISKNGDAQQETGRQVAAMNEAMSGVRSAVDRLHALELRREGS